MSVLSELPDESSSRPEAAKPAHRTDPLLTTGQASELCAVDPRTIARWADLGLIRSHRTAGGRRRILSSDLRDFMRARGMPVLAVDPPHRTRIAVVDDDRAVVKALLRMLSRVAPGADCRSAYDGFSAGALLTSFRPDIVFLDIVMPGLSGVEVCEHIRAKPELQRTSVVIISGHLTAALRLRLTAAGAVRFLEKPLNLADIASALVEVAPRHRGSASQTTDDGCAP
jgi:excisionase family DNA binding protein